jgi:hypothetical protein
MALESAFQSCRKQEPDVVVFLGDLFTYGNQPLEVIACLSEFRSTFKCQFIIGNHDQVYLDYFNSIDGFDSEYFTDLPDWIKESFEWTANQLGKDGQNFLNGLPWTYELELSQILLSHANPFGPKNWRYLNSKDDFSHCLLALEARNLKMGVFGHTHRCKIWYRAFGSVLEAPETLESEDSSYESMNHSIAAITLASLGQPRNESKKSFAYLLATDAQKVKIQPILIKYDNEKFKENLRTTFSAQSQLLKKLDFYY